jgi:TonB family protein
VLKKLRRNVSKSAFLVALALSFSATASGELSAGALFRSADSSTSLKIISSEELEFSPDRNSPNWICKYSQTGDSLRIVFTVLGSPQAVYMKVIPEGIEDNEGRKLYDEAHFEAAVLAAKQAREEKARRQAAAIASLPKPTSTTVAGPVSADTAKKLAVSGPSPEYPYEARRNKITGSGVIVMTVDTASGVVTGAEMAQSTGSPILDNAATSAFRRWRFKPGTVSRVRMPITFTMSGAQY